MNAAGRRRAKRAWLRRWAPGTSVIVKSTGMPGVVAMAYWSPWYPYVHLDLPGIAGKVHYYTWELQCL